MNVFYIYIYIYIRYRECWDLTIKNLGKELDISPSNVAKQQLGARLFHLLDQLSNQFDAMKPVTLIHGDYKISNVFVQPPKKVF